MHDQFRPWVPRRRHARWRREALRTNLWFVPTLMVALAAALFVLTYNLDRAALEGRLVLPGWVAAGSADTARQVLIGIAAAVITVAGVVFSITILALQLASQQFGPRMLRNFIRDLGTQASLGAFVATFVYALLTLASVGHVGSKEFVPHLSVTVSLGLTLVDLGVLIYFIHHVAVSIQLTSVVAGIARDFRKTLSELLDDAPPQSPHAAARDHLRAAREQIARTGVVVAASASGFLQAVGHRRLLHIAQACEASIELLLRPGQFVVAGQPLAVVWPPSAVAGVSRELARAHIVGPNRTLAQDPAFAVDQLVEVAIRALSPAVNDTFTALNCIDWLGDCLCLSARVELPAGVYRDRAGTVRLIEPAVTSDFLLKRASDKIRQAGRGMPAIFIRQLENLRRIALAAPPEAMHEGLRSQAEMILRASQESIPEESDRSDVRRAYDELVGDWQQENSADAREADLGREDGRGDS
jgi:uncharacterized membrane protein